MKPFVGLLLVAGSLLAQTPVIRDAFVVTEEKTLLRSMRLNRTLQVVVCKAEFDAWAKPTPIPEVMLYLDGRLMKTVAPGRLRLVTEADPVWKDAGLGTVAAKCGQAKAQSMAASEADLKKAAADADAKAAAESDPAKKDAAQKAAKLKHDEADQATVARTAATGAIADLDILAYYLDPKLVGKTDEWIRLQEKTWAGKSIDVSLGLQAGPPWPQQGSILLEPINLWWLGAWAVVFVVAVVVFIRYARNSDIIRDSGKLPDGEAKEKTFSLAKTSMAMWTFIVAGAMIFIFVVTWNENSLSATALSLIGISFGTTVLSGPAGGPDDPKKSKGFLTDLLTEGEGVSFHRYQMVLFSVILALVFMVNTATSLTMPEFDPKLLGLLGISSTTYLGFKLQNK